MKKNAFLLTVFFFLWVISCRTQKKTDAFNLEFETIDTADSSVRRYDYINADWYRINELLIRRDGLLTIRFDSLTTVLVLPDRTIQAIGYNPVIESSSLETEKFNSSDSVSFSKTDSTQSTGSKKKGESGSTESSLKKIDRKPSMTPWIGAGIAVAIALLAVLWFISKKFKI
jgi:hypothetical protein